MKWIGHTEFSPNYIPIYNKDLCFKNDVDINHWLEQWYSTYLQCYEALRNKENVYFICYEQLCSSKEYWTDILQILDIRKMYDFEFKESQKVISLKVDDSICSKGFSLYAELSKVKIRNE